MPNVLLISKTLYFHQYSADFTYFAPLARELFLYSWLIFRESGPYDNRQQYDCVTLLPNKQGAMTGGLQFEWQNHLVLSKAFRKDPNIEEYASVLLETGSNQLSYIENSQILFYKNLTLVQHGSP